MKIFGLNYVVSDEVKKLENCDSLILPGVGSFKTTRKLKKSYKLINNFVKQNKKVIGICLGAKIHDFNDEFGKTKGLDLIKGTVKKFRILKRYQQVSVPNVGWRVVQKIKRYLKNF